MFVYILSFLTLANINWIVNIFCIYIVMYFCSAPA